MKRVVFVFREDVERRNVIHFQIIPLIFSYYLQRESFLFVLVNTHRVYSRSRLRDHLYIYMTI
jgi:hypothetical protein